MDKITVFNQLCDEAKMLNDEQISLNLKNDILEYGKELFKILSPDCELNLLEELLLNFLKYSDKSMKSTNEIIETIENYLNTRESTFPNSLYDITFPHIMRCHRLINQMNVFEDEISVNHMFRKRWIKLIIPSKTQSLQEHCIKEGYLNDVGLLSDTFENLCCFKSLGQVYNAMKLIPLDVMVTDLNKFIKKCLMPVLLLSDCNLIKSNFSESVLDTKIVTLKIVKYLSDWAEEYEIVDKNPFQAIQVINMSTQILKISFGIQIDLSYFRTWPEPDLNSLALNIESYEISLKELLLTTVKELFTLQLQLHLQSDIWFIWRKCTRLNSVKELGIRRLVFQYLWTVTYTDFETEIKVAVEPLITKFRVDMDLVLDEWIRDALLTRVLSVGQDSIIDNSGDLSRLVLATKLIKSAYRKAHITLLLLQVPIVTAMYQDVTTTLDSSSVNGSLDDNFDDHTYHCNYDKTMTQLHAKCVSDLCDLAYMVSFQVEASTREAIIEALRLQRMKTLSFSYGIESFDPRSFRQIRYIAGAISARIDSKSSIRDATEIVQAWSAGGFDVSGLLCRAIVHRATCDLQTKIGEINDTEIFEQIQAYRRQLILDALNQIPPTRIKAVLESSLDCLISMINEQSLIEKEIDETQSTEVNYADKQIYCNLVDSSIIILSWYLDEKNNNSTGFRTGFIGQTKTDTVSNNSLSQHFWSVGADDSFSHLKPVCLTTLKRLRILSVDFNIFLTLGDLGNAQKCRNIASRYANLLVNKMIQNASDQNELQSLSVHHRRLCSLLNTSFLYFNHRVLKSLFKNNLKEDAVQFAKILAENYCETCREDGMISNSLHSETTDDEGMLLMDIAITLSSMAAQQVFASHPTTLASSLQNNLDVNLFIQLFETAQVLLQSTCSTCSISLLSQVIDLLQSSDVALSIFRRIEGDFSYSFSSTRPSGMNDNNFKVMESYFSRDGILMSANRVLPCLMKFCLKEIKRRNMYEESFLADHNNNTLPTDLNELATVLQRSENHMLALRILLTSWHTSLSKSQILRVSITSLSRKILSYREIDSSLAIAIIGLLPLELMIKELKSSVPSIQSDFSRLRTVASIGEELARMWDQEALLVIFQNLQMNARWWHILSSYGLKIDAKAFQDPDTKQRELAMRSIVPDLLIYTQLNLDLCHEFCQQFNLEPELATIIYIEKILLLPPSPANTWIKLIQKASHGVKEVVLMSIFRTVLMNIHPLDYEKIHYTCMWLANALNEEYSDHDIDDNDGNNSKPIDDDITEDEERFGNIRNSLKYSLKNTATFTEMKNYLNYSEMVAFLTVLSFPSDLLQKVSHISNFYQNLDEMYRTRLPFWQLLEDPWSIIEPLMMLDTDAATKLSPLCTFLHIEKDEFYSRAIMSTYTRTSDSSINCGYQSNFEIPPNQSSNILLDIVKNSIELVVSAKRKIEIWRWIFEKEIGRNKSIAVHGLNEAIRLLEDICHNSRSQYNQDELEELQDTLTELQMELIKINCRSCIDVLSESFKSDISVYLQTQQLIQMISNPFQLLKKIFECCIESCWNYQIFQLRLTGSILTIMDIIHKPFVPLLDSLVKVLGENVAMLSKHCKNLGSRKTISDPSVDVENMKNSITQTRTDYHMKSSTILLEDQWEDVVRDAIISKLLSDVDPLVESTSSGNATSNKKPFNDVPMPSFGTTTSIKNKNSTILRLTRSIWDNEESSSLKLTDGEVRRRDDIFLSFSLAVIIGSCQNLDKKISYIKQLEFVLKGGGGRTMRRITARSKLRAIQAILFLRNHESDGYFVYQIFKEDQDKLLARHSFLYCLAELNETRLLCSELTLADALGWETNQSDPKPLVQTWLHDEGSLVDATELSRDVLLASKLFDISLWKMLLMTMIHHDQYRSVVQTIIIMSQEKLLSIVIEKDVSIALSILDHVMKFTKEVVERVEKVLEVIRNKSSVDIIKQQKTSSLIEIDLNQSSFVQKSTYFTAQNKNRFDNLILIDSIDSNRENTSIDKKRKTLLIPRCNQGLQSVDQNPEELALSMIQSSELWKTFFQYIEFIRYSDETHSRLEVVIQEIMDVGKQCAIAVIDPYFNIQFLTIEQELNNVIDMKELIITYAIRTSVSLSNTIFTILRSNNSTVTKFSASGYLKSLVLDVINVCIENKQKITDTQSLSTYESSVGILIWNIFTTFATTSSKEEIKCGLTKLISDQDSIKIDRTGNNWLMMMLQVAASKWNCGEDDRIGLIHLMSWCLSENDEVDTSSMKTKSEFILTTFENLNSKDKKSILLAAESLRSYVKISNPDLLNVILRTLSS